jgi:hypothetical protein
VAGTDKPTELLPGEDPEHRVVGCNLRQVEVCPIQGQLGLAFLTKHRMRFCRKPQRPTGHDMA